MNDNDVSEIMKLMREIKEQLIEMNENMELILNDTGRIGE